MDFSCAHAELNCFVTSCDETSRDHHSSRALSCVALPRDAHRISLIQMRARHIEEQGALLFSTYSLPRFTNPQRTGDVKYVVK